MTMKTVGIIGATGRTGGWVLDDCLQKGYQVVCLVRNPDKLKQYTMESSNSAYDESKKDLLQIVKGDATTKDGIQALLGAAVTKPGQTKIDVIISVVGSSKSALVVKKTAEAVVDALATLDDTTTDVPRIVWMTATGVNEATDQAKSYPLFGGTPSRWFFGYGLFGFLQFKLLIPYVISQELWDDMGHSEDVIRANVKIYSRTTIVRPTNMWPVSEHPTFSEAWWNEGGNSEDDRKYCLIEADDPPPGKWIYKRAISAALVDLVTDPTHDGTAKSLFAAPKE